MEGHILAFIHIHIFRYAYKHAKYASPSYVPIHHRRDYSLCQVGAISPTWLQLNGILVAYELELWRVVTTFLLIGPAGFEWILSVGMFTQVSQSLETSLFTERRGIMCF